MQDIMNQNSTKGTVDAETLAVLKELVRLHADWDKGSAYVSVQFVKENDAVIKRSRALIERASTTWK